MAVTQSVEPSGRLVPGEDPCTAPVTVLHVGVSDSQSEDRKSQSSGGDADDGTPLGTRLGRDDRIDVDAVETPEAAAGRLDAADCVVSEADRLDADLVDLLTTVRERDPALPFVLLASDPDREVVDALCETPWADCLSWDGDADQVDLLVRRIHQVVGYRRVTALARRALAAVEQGSDPIAIVAPDGTVEFVNPLLARQLGSTPEDLIGRNWRELYSDDEVARLEADAFPSLADGWRWIGDCELRRDDGSTFVAQTRIDALDDDGLLFTVSDPDDR